MPQRIRTDSTTRNRTARRSDIRHRQTVSSTGDGAQLGAVEDPAQGARTAPQRSRAADGHALRRAADPAAAGALDSLRGCPAL